MKQHIHIPIICIVVCVISLTITGCERHTAAWQRMDMAENLMETAPDAALEILKDVNYHNLGGKEEAARYALLKSIALDKNYIDATDFTVLQPAIDYYLKKGTPDEKLKTYYYQGRIFQNKGDRDNAFGFFLPRVWI